MSGSDNGSAPVTWTAYRSSNATLEIGTDPVVDTGSISALAAGATSSLVNISGTWPSSPGTYYMIVKVSASDDAVPGNNSTASLAYTPTKKVADEREISFPIFSGSINI